MLQVVPPRESAWTNVRAVKRGCEVPLDVHGGLYLFRLSDETGTIAFPETLVKVLTPPSAPVIWGIGRNVCISLGSACLSKASVTKRSSLRYIVSWRRVCEFSDAEPEGNVDLQYLKYKQILAAFPRLHKDADYSITLRAVLSQTNPEGEIEVLQSLESHATSWSTRLRLPSCIASRGAIRLTLPDALDSCGLLAAHGLKARCFVIGKDDSMLSFQRLKKKAGSSTLPGARMVNVCDVPADADCSIQVCCAIDLRKLGCEYFFWDMTSCLLVRTQPGPPTFYDTARTGLTRHPSFVVSWSGRRPIISSYESLPLHPYQMQVYAPKAGSYVTIASTFASKVDALAAFAAHGADVPPVEPGMCLCIRVLRTTLNPDHLLSTGNVPTVITPGPVPPAVVILSKKSDLIHVSWDGSLDVTQVPFVTSPLPCKMILEATSGHMSDSTSTTPSLNDSCSHSKGLLRSQNFRAVSTASNSAAVTIKLARGREYLFRFRLQTAHGVTTSSPVKIRTKAVVPNAPQAPVGIIAYFVSATGHRAPFLRISWDTPRSHGVPISHYLVQTRRVDTNTGAWKEWCTIYHGPQASCADAATLNHANIRAEYRVKAGCALGWGSYSQVLAVDSSEGIESWGGELARGDVHVEVDLHSARPRRLPDHKNTEFSGRLPRVPPSATTMLSWPRDECCDVVLAGTKHSIRSKVVAREMIREVTNLLCYSIAPEIFTLSLSSLNA